MHTYTERERRVQNQQLQAIYADMYALASIKFGASSSHRAHMMNRITCDSNKIPHPKDDEKNIAKFMRRSSMKKTRRKTYHLLCAFSALQKCQDYIYFLYKRRED